MEGLPTAFVAGLIMQKDWERLYYTLKGLNDTEERTTVLRDALESVGSLHAAYLVHDAVRTIAHLTSEQE